VLGIEIEGAPVERQLRCALQKLARRIREELRDVDLLDRPAPSPPAIVASELAIQARAA